MNTSYQGVPSAEWLETNGIGGYAGSTVSGANTRRYHGILVAAAHPPVGRMVMLAKLDEEIVHGDEHIELGTNQYPGTIHPAGYHYIKEFSRELFPEWIYELPNGTRIRKTMAAIHGENTTVIIYEILYAERAFTMEWLPLIAGRDYHSIHRRNDGYRSQYEFEDGLFHTKPYDNSPGLYISVPQGGFRESAGWFNNVEYAVEQYRGLEFTEDLFNHGKFTREVQQHDRFGIIVSDRHPAGRDAVRLFEQEKQRREKMVASYAAPLTRKLVLAADQFVVQRGIDLKTIIAGYHWFSDWGRDTMIALPGLCLSTGRFDDARRILKAFSENVSMGMLPNRFPDYEGEDVEYNTVDATLWYFIAVHKFLQATGDRTFVLTELLPVLKQIIDWHFKGTRYQIRVDEQDGMLSAGEEGQQLTWMDARIGNWVVTPRMGKAVEINALWYNALVIFADLLRMNGQVQDADLVMGSAAKCKKHFLSLFWNESGKCLYDYIRGDHRDDAIRPNQVLALSLPFSLIDDASKAASILSVVTEKLYTPVGLRSLSADHPDFKNHYGGDPYHRDSAYHQGTVWSWLMGPYIDAVIANPGFTWLDGSSGFRAAKTIVQNFRYHLQEACVGSVSEIFDAEAPFTPRGCVAQAWGVGEMLRMIMDYPLLTEEVEKKPEVPEPMRA